MIRIVKSTWLVLVLFLSAASLKGAVGTLNWADYTTAWSSGATSFTAYNVNGSGVAITFTVSITGGAFSSGYPQVNSTPIPTSTTHGLQLLVDFASNGSSSYATVSVSFSKPVTNLVMPFYDIDTGTAGGGGKLKYVDVVAFTGDKPATLSVADATYVQAVPPLSLLIGKKVNADPSPLGSATATWGSTELSSAGFQYSSNNFGAQGDPTEQGIALGNLTFTYTPVPEVGQGVGLLLGGVLFVYFQRKRILSKRDSA